MSLLDESVMKDLSNNQKYLYDISTAVGLCQVSESLTARQPRRILHSRWLITASRLLKLYVSTNNPSDTLTDLTKF